jgi:hypothetical protein
MTATRNLPQSGGEGWIAAMTATVPARPAAYLRTAHAGGSDQAIQRQRRMVLRAAEGLGWPEPAVCADTGRSGWNRPGSALATLTAEIRAGKARTRRPDPAPGTRADSR